MARYEYGSRRVELSPGDTVLMMSDGFPELTNDKGEPLGYPAVQELFRENGTEGPEELIARLATAAEAWSGSTHPSDDITFVALRVRS